jgi:hypothetical protein
MSSSATAKFLDGMYDGRFLVFPGVYAPLKRPYTSGCS